MRLFVGDPFLQGMSSGLSPAPDEASQVSDSNAIYIETFETP